MRPDLLPTTFEGKLYRLVEEMGEVMQALGKMGRFGYTAEDVVTGIKYNNIGDLFRELEDLRHAVTQVLDNQMVELESPYGLIRPADGVVISNGERGQRLPNGMIMFAGRTMPVTVPMHWLVDVCRPDGIVEGSGPNACDQEEGA